MTDTIETIIIGAGQAGLALSYCLTQRGREHLLLERGRIAERWRTERWDSFTLLSPNWHARLPAYQYQGPEPDGFMGREEIVQYFEQYAASFDPPVRTHATVTCIEQIPALGYQIEVNHSEILRAANVVVAIGPFQRPHVPSLAQDLPPDLVQLHTTQYRNSAQLPPGAVLIVGSGTSGQQIAEELHNNGRQVYLAVGLHAKLPRRYRGHDAVWWMDVTGSFDQTVDSAPQAAHRPGGALSGVGHDLDLRQFAQDGIELLGHLRSVASTALTFANDVEESLADGESVEIAFKREVDEYIARTGMDVPPEDESKESRALRQIRVVSPTDLDLRTAGITSVIWATGFRNDLDWLHVPVLDSHGEPIHQRGITRFPGLSFLGLQWLFKRKSSFVDGAAEDAQYLAEHIASRRS